MRKPATPKAGPAPSGQGVIVTALCLMTGVVPLACLPGIYDYMLLPKLLTLHACVALCAGGWLVRTRGGRDVVRFAASPLTLPALLGLGTAALSSLSTTHPLGTAVEWVNQACLIVLMWIVAGALPLSRIRPVLWAGALAGLAVGTIGILQYHSLGFLDIPAAAPPGATLGNRNFVAEYLVCAIPLSVLLFVTEKRGPALLVSGLSAALMGACLVCTRTRSAWLGAMGALLCAAAMAGFHPGLRGSLREALGVYLDRRKARWGGGFLALFLVLSLLPARRPVLPGTRADIVSTAVSALQRDPGVTERLTAWNTSLRMAGDHPILGVGPGGWTRFYPLYDGGVTNTVAQAMDNPHNDYLWIVSEYGLVGLGAHLWLLVAGMGCVLRMSRHREPFARLTALAFALSLLSVFGAACFGFPRANPQTAMFPGLLFGMAAGATEPHPPPTPPSPSGRDRQRKLSEGGEGRGDYGISEATGRVRSFAVRLAPYLFLALSLTAVVLSWMRIEFDRRYLLATFRGGPQKNWPALLSEADGALEYGIFRPHILVLRGDALKHLERYAEAETAYRQALSCAPNAWETHERLGALYLQQGRLDEAAKHVQSALSLCPSSTDSRNNLGVICLKQGDLTRAEQAFREVLGATPRNAGVHMNLASLFLARQQPDSVVAHSRQALRLDPALSQAYLSLADASRMLGRQREALDAYRTFLGLWRGDPSLVRLVQERISLCEEQLRK